MASGDRPLVRVTDNDSFAAMKILARVARPCPQSKLEAGEKLLQAWYWASKRHRGEPTPNLDFLHPKSLQKSRIEAKLRTFSKDLWKSFEAARWLQAIIMSDAGKQHKWFDGFSHITQRSLGASKWNAAPERRAGFESGELAETSPNEDDAGYLRESIWRKRRPIVHMALAAGNAISQAAQEREQPSEKLSQLIAEWEACQRAIVAGDETADTIAEWNRLSKAVSEERKISRQPLELEALVFDPVWVAPALEQAEEWARTIESRNLVSGGPLWRFVR